MDKQVGFIGLGRMGNPMANRMLAAGFQVTVFDTNAETVKALVAKGATAAASPVDLASKVATVLLSLPTPTVVEAVANAVSSGTKVKTVIDLSTTGPRVAQKVAAALAAKGITGVDAPVSGGIAGAVKGTLAVMVACPKPLYETLAPMLGHIGKVFFIGEKPGMGQMMKLCNNLLSATAMAATSEAVVLGVKAGLDPAVMIDVINSGSGMNTASRDKFPKSVLPRTFDFGFTTGLLWKDVRLCVDEAEALGVPMMVGSAVKQMWLHANQQLGPDCDFTEIVKLPERWAGVVVKKSER